MSNENQFNEQLPDEPDVPAEELNVSVDTSQPGSAPQTVEKEPSRFAQSMQEKFGAQSAFGRSMRSFLRWTVLIVGIFAVGMLVSYILFGMPLAKQLKEATAQIESLNQSMDEANNTMTALSADLESEKDLRLQAQLAMEEVEGRYEARAVAGYVQQAQIALLQKDNSGVKTALESADKELEKLDVYLSSKDANLADTIISRLTLIQKEYLTDAVTASQDLVILLDRLAEAEALFEG